jgi:hypothetical protein
MRSARTGAQSAPALRPPVCCGVSLVLGESAVDGSVTNSPLARTWLWNLLGVAAYLAPGRQLSRIRLSASGAGERLLCTLSGRLLRVDCRHSTLLGRSSLSAGDDCQSEGSRVLSHGTSPAPPHRSTVSTALAATPTSTALGGHKVVGREFVAVAAAAWRQDGPADVLPDEKREY